MNTATDTNIDQNKGIFLSEPRKIDVKKDSIQVEDIVVLLTKVSDHLIDTLGLKHYGWYTTDNGRNVREKLAKGNTYTIFSASGKVIATFTISKEKSMYDNAMFEDGNGVVEGQSQFDDKPAYYLSMMCVSPDLQGNGVGKRVMRMMEGIVEIDARASNQSSYLIRFDAREEYVQLIKFYKNLGYVGVGRVNEGEGENYVLYEKETFLHGIEGEQDNDYTPES